MKKIFLPFMLVIFLITGCAGNKDSDKVGDTKLIIGIDDNYAPMAFHDEKGELVGFDIDLARETANRMDVEVEFKPIDWSKKKEEITSGNIDIIWNGLDITDERKEYMIFSKPYMKDRQIILVKAGNDQGIITEGDMEGKIVGTQAGASPENYINGNEELLNSLREFKTYPNFKEAFTALDSGEIDVLICGELTARYEIGKTPGKFKVIEVTVGPVWEIGVGFRKDNVALRDRVQKAFDEIVKDGTAREISEKWFQADLINYKR